jgi:glycosyltransferase involved in cell wall biosynthesis
VIGYVGSIAPRLDVALIESLARARPDWLIELVGPVSPLVDVGSLRAFANVRLVGEIPYDDVPATIARFDVGILPLHDIDFAYYCSPIQVFDYLAAGKPVVSTPVAQLEGWGDIVRVARRAEFVEAVARALDETGEAHEQKRRGFAHANSWNIRVRDVLRILDAVYPGLTSGQPPSLPAVHAAVS